MNFWEWSEPIKQSLNSSVRQIPTKFTNRITSRTYEKMKFWLKVVTDRPETKKHPALLRDLALVIAKEATVFQVSSLGQIKGLLELTREPRPRILWEISPEILFFRKSLEPICFTTLDASKKHQVTELSSIISCTETKQARLYVLCRLLSRASFRNSGWIRL